jgi:hypothetical protein
MYTALIGFAPFGIILLGVAILGVFYFAGRLDQKTLEDVLMGLLTVVGAIWIVAIIVRIVCLNIVPYEKFEDVSGSSDPVASLLSGIADAETKACTLITRTNKFIKANQGHAGQLNPDLVTQAQEAALSAAGGDIVDCGASWPSGEAALTEADNRLTRLETTLNGFTGPTFLKTYNKTVPCPAVESFEDISGTPTLKSLNKRLTAVNTLMQTQEQKYLKPIDQKTEQLKKGQASDCDKKQGANTAMKNSIGATPTSTSTSTSAKS